MSHHNSVASGHMTVGHNNAVKAISLGYTDDSDGGLKLTIAEDSCEIGTSSAGVGGKGFCLTRYQAQDLGQRLLNWGLAASDS